MSLYNLRVFIPESSSEEPFETHVIAPKQKKSDSYPYKWDGINSLEKQHEQEFLTNEEDLSSDEKDKIQTKIELPTKNKHVKLGALVNPHVFLPAKEKDSNLLSLKDAEELMESLVGPDYPNGGTLQNLFFGTALEPHNATGQGAYERNFQPDPEPPEELGKGDHQDSSPTLVAPKQFIPKEESLNPAVKKIKEKITKDLNKKRNIKLGVDKY